MATSEEIFETEEYVVYATLIESWYVSDNTHLIVIEDYIGLDLWGDNLEERLASIKEAFPNLTEEIMADFKTRNSQPSPLKPLIPLKVPYVLISSQEMEDLFQINENGWDEFYKRYPNLQGTMTLSRVGFNGDVNQALVYVGNQSHWRAGSGHFVLLIKENDRWKVQNETMVWIS
jgi:hypothetical protein